MFSGVSTPSSRIFSRIWVTPKLACGWMPAVCAIATRRARDLRTTAKFRHMVRNARVTVPVDAPPRETSVAGYGRAEVVALESAAYEGAFAIVPRYVADPVAYLDARNYEPRVLIRITPHELVSWKP